MSRYSNLIDNLRIEDVKNLMEQLGATLYKETDDYCLYNTICHNPDPAEASPKLYFYKDTKLFVCYTEDGPQNIFKFLEHYYQCRNYVYDWYKDIYQVVESCSAHTLEVAPKRELKRDKYAKKEQPTLQTYPEGILEIFTKYYPIEWLNDGISKEAMDKFNIRFSASRNKIIIPHYNAMGQLVGIRGRALNTEEVEAFGKYMPVKIEDKCYSHALSLNLYGLNLNKENIAKYGVAYIFEGEKSVLLNENFSTPNCAVASCGSNLNIYQVKLLIKYCHPKEIVLCYDKEELPGEEKYFNKLYKICEKYKKYCNFSFVYDRRKLLELKDAPCDKGEEIFRKLVEERVRVI